MLHLTCIDILAYLELEYADNLYLRITESTWPAVDRRGQ